MLAKLFEYDDRPLYDAAQIVSGHTIKHLMAAVGLWFLVMMLRQRFASRSVHAVHPPHVDSSLGGDRR